MARLLLSLLALAVCVTVIMAAHTLEKKVDAVVEKGKDETMDTAELVIPITKYRRYFYGHYGYPFYGYGYGHTHGGSYIGFPFYGYGHKYGYSHHGFYG